MGILLSGIMNFGLILANQNQLNSIVSAGILYAAGHDKTTSEVEAVMQGVTSMSSLNIEVSDSCQCLGGGSVACSSTCPEGGTPGRYITAKATSEVDLLAPAFIIDNPFPTSSQGTIRTE